MKPTKSILDPTFRYMSSAQTDLRKTFARVRREQRELAEKMRRETQAKVTELRRKP